MKTFTTTFSIIALLFSMNSFSFNDLHDINPPLQPREPGFDISLNDKININPPLQPRDPGNGFSNF